MHDRAHEIRKYYNDPTSSFATPLKDKHKKAYPINDIYWTSEIKEKTGDHLTFWNI